LVSTTTTMPRLASLGIDVEALRGVRRPLVRTCVDWSERRHHIAGAIGAAIAQTFLTRAWVRRAADHRGLHITAEGTEALARELAITLR
jgi:hypothetical protein